MSFELDLEGEEAYYSKKKQDEDFRAALLTENFTKLPKGMFGHEDQQVSVAHGEFGWYISYSYHARDTSIYFFHLLDMKAWQGCITYNDATKPWHSSNHERWTGAWRDVRSKLKEELDLTEIISDIDPKDITADQIVAILLME